MTMPGPIPLWLSVILMLWLAWGAVWLAAALWADRTVGSAGAARQAPYRIVNLIGWIALFGDGLVQRRDGILHWHYFLPPLWRNPDWIGWLLAALVAAGFGLAIWSRLTLGRLWSAAVTRKEGHRIVDSGPYALTRHPIYTALLSGALGLSLAKATPIALGAAILLIIGYHLKARVEERFLSAELGPRAYAAYRRRVPMLIPFAPAARS